MVAQMVELRKGKMSEEDCRAALKKGNYFGTMLVKQGKADALLGGATYSTADTVRPALQLVKTRKGAHLVSSSFILYREGKNGPEKLCMATMRMMKGIERKMLTITPSSLLSQPMGWMPPLSVTFRMMPSGRPMR